MSNLSYKKTQLTNLKVVGELDASNMTILVNDEYRKLNTLLSDFDGCTIEFAIKTKLETNLDIPE